MNNLHRHNLEKFRKQLAESKDEIFSAKYCSNFWQRRKPKIVLPPKKNPARD